ncbi:hypothetical protein HU200_067785 [Digitaria exilis]|uniref:Uncharacterized protein n=1 Tax=Digitaria exilis TaxID=1010633 RepID=A0A834ZZV3_9POAL|nr:hypothetical protein HU200_067785 [Digitaria exilis]
MLHRRNMHLERILSISSLSVLSVKLAGFTWVLNGTLRLIINLCSCELGRSLALSFSGRSSFLPCGLCGCTGTALSLMGPLFPLMPGGKSFWRR